MEAVTDLAEKTDIKEACTALGMPRATYYRWKKAAANRLPKQKSTRIPPLKLSAEERQEVLTTLNSERFVDQSPGEIHSILLDEGVYHCSERTMYRVLSAEDQVRERRNQRRTNHYKKPELIATAPNEVWSWDITKLKGPKKWTYFYLYVILDIFSRYVVGWMVADREADTLAEQLISETCYKQNIQRSQLTLHADRGASMKSKRVAFLLADLGVTKSHSRPYTSDDNPFSEAQFKTLKYCPEFPERFGCIEDAKAFCRAFFKWYNNEHRHSGINRLTPQMVHTGSAQRVLKQRNNVLSEAFKHHPERFKYREPDAGSLHQAVWINPPEKEKEVEKAA